MQSKVILVLAAVLLAGCDGCEGDNVKKVAQAPDGTVLWKDHCSGVYFSSRGTQYAKQVGKTHQTVRVPNSDDEGN